MKIGYIGLGNMGKGMVLNLLKNKHDVFVWSRTSEKVLEMEKKGAIGCSSPNEVSSKADFVMACLVDEEASTSVFLEDYALIKNAREGQIFVDHGTVSPLLSKSMYECALENKAHFLDAPISGGPDGSPNGTLAIMAGGSEKDIATIQSVMDTVSTTFTAFGPTGSGQIVKMVNQILVLNNYVILAEALALAEAGGIDATKIPHALAAGHAQSSLLKRNFPLMIERNYLPRGFARQILKDLDALHDLGKELKSPTPMSSQAASLYRILVSKGYGELDGTAILKLYDQNEMV